MYEVILRRGIKGTSSWSFEKFDDADRNIKTLEAHYGRTCTREEVGGNVRYICDASDWERAKRPKRFKDALVIQLGAVNPSGICHTIIEACREVQDEGGSTQDDPAIRLMVHQLAFICKVDQINTKPNEYGELTKACKKAIREGIE